MLVYQRVLLSCHRDYWWIPYYLFFVNLKQWWRAKWNGTPQTWYNDATPHRNFNMKHEVSKMSWLLDMVGFHLALGWGCKGSWNESGPEGNDRPWSRNGCFTVTQGSRILRVHQLIQKSQDMLGQENQHESNMCVANKLGIPPNKMAM